jgi:hypothetical protein
MAQDPLLKKTIGQLTPEEHQLFVERLAHTIEDALKQKGFSSFEHFIESITEAFGASLKTGFEAFNESNRLMKYPIGILAENGWYLSLDMALADTVEVAKLFSEGHVKAANQRMVDFYNKNQSSVEETIRKHFPLRKKIIKAAFEAHRKRNYELSIPAMLTQADGICNDLVGTHLFRKRKGSPATLQFANQFATDVLLSSLLEPLRREGQIRVDTRRLKTTSGVLNRHGILHGLIVDYASEENSFKVISLLSYLSDIVRDAVQAKPPNHSLKLTESTARDFAAHKNVD